MGWHFEHYSRKNRGTDGARGTAGTGRGEGILLGVIYVGKPKWESVSKLWKAFYDRNHCRDR